MHKATQKAGIKKAKVLLKIYLQKLATDTVRLTFLQT